MDILARTLQALLSKQTICRYSAGDLHGYLTDPDRGDMLEVTLSRIGLRLGVTSSKRTFFATPASQREGEVLLRSEARDIVEGTNRILAFSEFWQDVDKASPPLEMGLVISAGRIVAAIEDHSSLGEKLMLLADSFGLRPDTHAQAASRVLRKFADDGYLVELNAAREEYVVSGKVDYAFDNLEQFLAHIPRLTERVGEIETEIQGDLFS